MILATVLVGMLLLFVEGRILIKQSQWKELIVVISIICIAIVVCVINSIGYKDPLKIMEDWLSPIGEYIFK